MGWPVWKFYDGVTCMSDTLTGMVSLWHTGELGSPWTVDQSTYVCPFQHNRYLLRPFTWQLASPRTMILRELRESLKSPTITSAAFSQSVTSLFTARIQVDGVRLHIWIGGVVENWQPFLIFHTPFRLWAPLEQLFCLVSLGSLRS